MIIKNQHPHSKNAVIYQVRLHDNKELIDPFAHTLQIYHKAMTMASAQLEIWDSEFALANNHSLIHHMQYRIKSADSIMSKLIVVVVLLDLHAVYHIGKPPFCGS